MSESTQSPEIVPVPTGRGNDTGPLPRAVKLRVRELLEAGELVALPTETVYGIAARADQDAPLDRLRALKARDPGLTFTWHVSARDAAGSFGSLRPLARRLAERYWPGPLTLVLEGVPSGLERIAKDGWTGVRLPAHPATRALLEFAPFPVVLSSANRSGEPPASSAAEAVEASGEGLALVVDGGPARLGEASTVLKLGRGTFDLLREGLLPLTDLARTAGRRIAFVCTGNTCRSPMAEGLARLLLAEKLGVGLESIGRFGFEVASMGIAAGPGSSISRHAADVLAAAGVDADAHTSRPAIPEELGRFDEVLCLTHGHLEALRGMLPPGKAKRLALLDPDGEDVPDPIGGSRGDYDACAARIRRALERRLDAWA